MRSVIQSSFVILTVSLLTADVSAATGVVLAIPAFLLTGHYSRTFEREADAHAFTLLSERGLSPEWFLYALNRVQAASPEPANENFEDRLGRYVSTHPTNAERVAAASTAASGYAPIEQALPAATPLRRWLLGCA